MSENQSGACLVCRKHRGELEIPGGSIFEDDLIFVSHAQFWAGETDKYLGYLFVEPKRHVAELGDLTEAEAQALGLLVSRLSRALMQSEGAEHVYAFVIGDGVPHVHVHVIGRYPGAPRQFWGPKVDEWPGAPRGRANDIALVTNRLRAFLKKEYA